MFYLLAATTSLTQGAATRSELRRRGWFDSARPGAVAEPDLAQWLDLVALGTVADVVTLDRNNRILVEQSYRQRSACSARDLVICVNDKTPTSGLLGRNGLWGASAKATATTAPE